MKWEWESQDSRQSTSTRRTSVHSPLYRFSHCHDLALPTFDQVSILEWLWLQGKFIRHSRAKKSLTRCQEIIDEHKELLISHLGISHEEHCADILYPGFQAQTGQVHLQKQSISEISEKRVWLKEMPNPLFRIGTIFLSTLMGNKAKWQWR